MGSETETIMLTMGALFLFGCLYAILINWMRRTGRLDGFTAFMVVFGVLVTLVASTAVHHPDPWLDFLSTVACFGSSGLPMIVESAFLDYGERRVRDERSIVQQTNSEVGNA